MPCPKCDYHAMRLLRGKWQCKSSSCDYREGGSKTNFIAPTHDLCFIDPEVTRRELVRVHDMPMGDIVRESGRGN